jgi:hypothetical protein
MVNQRVRGNDSFFVSNQLAPEIRGITFRTLPGSV